MMKAARDAVADDGPRLLGVTILTSFTADDVQEVWNKEVLSVRDEVARLSAIAADAGLHGIVTSPLEAEAMKRRHGTGFLVVTPGIRPEGSGSGDQARTSSPAAAVRAGADYLVIGRPILDANDPVAAVERIIGEMSQPQEAG
jgi:orotidine-5'-phosphate decarboxylase